MSIGGIPFDQYVDITSGVGGIAQASNRDLGWRILTENVLQPAGTVTEFTSAAAVSVVFGAAAEETLQAQFYFGFISKLSTTPNTISFAFWDSGSDSLTVGLTEMTELNNNFGSFSVIPAVALIQAEVVEAATWNDGENVKFMYLQGVLAADAVAFAAATAALSGTALTLFDDTLPTDEYPWALPGAIMAATPYFRRNSVQNYMFQQAALTPSVTTKAFADIYDPIFVNYYGQTQQAGADISFYQRGFLQGLATAPLDMGVYANEVFLKDAVGVSIINLLLALSAVPANQTGSAQVLAAVQGDIDDALTSGIISVGKLLNATQIAFVTAVTNDPQAFLQIQNIGYWIEAVIQEPVANEFEVAYTLLYSKNDVVRKVVGTHTLI